MVSKYEISRETLMILPISEEKSLVYEMDQEITVKRGTSEIVDDSCRFFGSSYLGRFEGTKKLVGFKYKAPIIIEESNEIIFFPTASPRIKDCIWISLNNIKDYKKCEKQTTLIFRNNQAITIPVSLGCIENQILRATRLGAVLGKNKKHIKISRIWLIFFDIFAYLGFFWGLFYDIMEICIGVLNSIKMENRGIKMKK